MTASQEVPQPATTENRDVYASPDSIVSGNKEEGEISEDPASAFSAAETPQVEQEQENAGSEQMQDGGTHEIIVKQLQDKEFVVHVTPETRLGELRDVIRERCEVPNQRQRLLWQGRPLTDDSQTLADLFTASIRPVVHLVPIPADVDLDQRQTSDQRPEPFVSETPGGTTIFMFSTSYLPTDPSAEPSAGAPSQSDQGTAGDAASAAGANPEDRAAANPGLPQPNSSQPTMFTPSVLGRGALNAFTRTLQSAVRNPGSGVPSGAPEAPPANISHFIGQFITDMSESLQRQQHQSAISPEQSHIAGARRSDRQQRSLLRWDQLEEFREGVCRLSNSRFAPLRDIPEPASTNLMSSLAMFVTVYCQARNIFNAALSEVVLWHQGCTTTPSLNFDLVSRLASIGSSLDMNLSAAFVQLALEGNRADTECPRDAVPTTNDRRESMQESIDHSVYEDALDEPSMSPITHTGDATTGSLTAHPTEGRSESVAPPLIDPTNISQISAYIRPLSVSSAPPQHLQGVDGSQPNDDASPANRTTPLQSASPKSDKHDLPPKKEAITIERRERVPVPATPAFNVPLSPEDSFIELSEMSPIVQERLRSWTSDARKFSASVIPAARRHVPSRAYSMGNVSVGDSGLFGNFSKRDDVKVANPANAFRLQWHRAALHERVADGGRIPNEVLDKLTRLHNAQNLLDIASLAEKDSNFNAERQKYPTLVRLLKIIGGLKKE